MDIYFFKIASLLYLLGTLAYLGYIFFLKEALSKSATTVVFVGFASHTLALLVRYAEAGYTPVTNLYESLSFFAWMVIGILLVVQLKYPVRVLGAFLSPIALILMLFALALPKEIIPLAPVLKSFWHPFHVFFAFLGNAIFALAFCCGVMYLIQEHQLKSKKMGAITQRLPSLMVLDDLNYQSLKFGFPSVDPRNHHRCHLGGICLGPLLGLGSQGDMVSDHLVSLCRLASSAADRGMEGPQSRDHGHCRVPGGSVHLPRREPRAPRASYLRQLVISGIRVWNSSSSD